MYWLVLGLVLRPVLAVVVLMLWLLGLLYLQTVLYQCSAVVFGNKFGKEKVFDEYHGCIV